MGRLQRAVRWWIKGWQDFVTVAGRFLGESSFSGPGAGGSATAVAVVSDLLSLAARPGRDVQEEPRFKNSASGGCGQEMQCSHSLPNSRSSAQHPR